MNERTAHVRVRGGVDPKRNATVARAEGGGFVEVGVFRVVLYGHQAVRVLFVGLEVRVADAAVLGSLIAS